MTEEDPAPSPAAPPDARTMSNAEFIAAKAALFEAERRTAAQRREQAVMADLERRFPPRTSR